jgi:hypothetical protein
MRVIAVALVLCACDEPAPTVHAPPSRAATPRTFPTDQATIDSLTARAEVVSDDLGTSRREGSAGTRTVSVAERTRGRSSSLTEEALREAAELATSREPEGDTPCDQAFAAFAELNAQMRARDPEGRHPAPDRRRFMTGCRAKPPELQRCLVPSYFTANRADCQRAVGTRGFGGDEPAEETSTEGTPVPEVEP